MIRNNDHTPIDAIHCSETQLAMLKVKMKVLQTQQEQQIGLSGTVSVSECFPRSRDEDEQGQNGFKA